MKTDLRKARQFCELLFTWLCHDLADTNLVLQRIKAIAAHAPGHAETRFCKGCVLPIVDRVANQYLNSTFSLTREQIRNSLRCEGISNLKTIYIPGEDQSGYSTFTWGENYQRVSKTGKIYPSDSRGYQPCPDFGIVHKGNAEFCLVGETKFSVTATKVEPLLNEVRRDLRYYVGLPAEPTKDWDYDVGFGIAYAAGGAGPRQSYLFDADWQSDRFVVACFHA
jgi:hypothetical protein